MHIKPNIDITQFLLQVKKCKHDVYYETQEGDILNLNSALSQYVFCSLTIQPKYWQTGTIRCEDESDRAILKPFLEAIP